MDTEPLVETPATALEFLRQGLQEAKSTLDDLEESKARAKQNYSLNNQERALFLSALEIKIVQAERDVNRMNVKLATQVIKFKKETFWRSF